MLSAMSSDEKSRSQRAIKRPRVPPGPLADLKALLYQLYLEAKTPRLDQIEKWAAMAGQAGMPGRDTVARIIGSATMPPSQADLVTVVTVLARAARWDDPDDAVRRARDMWVAAGMATPVGVLLAEVTDPFALEVHRPVQPDREQAGLPDLPWYLQREHDAALAGMVTAAAQGRSQIAVLVGGSSTGKTRACWEALHPLRDQPGPWRLWHPIDPTRPDAALRDLPGIGPRTVVWLNEAQFYLDPAEAGLGERVAARLRELLRDPGRAPVLVLATLWQQFWDTLTDRPAADENDRHAQARDLLAGHDIAVDDALTPAQVRQLAGAEDPRLALAAAAAKEDGRVIQFLAGAAELLARYRNAEPPAKALIHAAMDARRLGMGAGLPHAFLEAAAPGYLTDDQWDQLGEDWLKQALAYTAKPCKGVRGPLTRIRPRPAEHAARHRRDQPASMATAAGPLYRLADYLDQHGRAHRASQIPPAGFWPAAAAHAAPGDQAALGDAADARGLYRDAAQLHKNAAAAGNPRAAFYLSDPPACLHADPRPAHWAAAHAALDNLYDVADLLFRLREAGAQEQAAALAGRAAAQVPLKDPDAVADLLDSMREVGAHEQAAALLARDPAVHVALDDPRAVVRLLGSLREAGAHEQATALLHRDPAVHVALDDLRAVADLMGRLREAGAHEQAAALAGRAAAHTSLDNPDAVADLLDSMREAGAHEQAAALAGRAAAHTPLDDPPAVVRLLGRLREAGAQEQAAALASRAAAHTPLDNPVAWLLGRLQAAGAQEQAAALASRAAAHTPLDNPPAVASLLDSLREAGANEQATALLARDPAAHAPLDDPPAVARLLESLREAGAQEQAAALAGRAAAHTPLDDPGRLVFLLDSLREAGAHEQAAALAGRAAAHAPLHRPGAVFILLDSLREAGAQEQAAVLAGRAAAHAALDDPGAVADLLDSLRLAGADEQAAVLAGRAAAQVPLKDPSHDPGAVAWLLGRLQAAGAQEQAAVLAGRAAAHAPLDDPGAVVRLLGRLREAGAQEQAAVLAGRAAAHAPLDDLSAVVRLLGRMREAGAQEQAAVLAGRAAAHTPLDDPGRVAWLLGRLREAGAHEQAAALLHRDPAAHASLGNPDDVFELLGRLREVGAHEQAAALADRLPAAGMFGLFLGQKGLADQFHFGREADGTPAAPWGWGDLDLSLVPRLRGP